MEPIEELGYGKRKIVPTQEADLVNDIKLGSLDITAAPLALS